MGNSELIGQGSAIQRAFDCQAATLEHVGIDHGGAYIFVTEELLHGADVVAALEQMGGEGMAECMGTDRLGNTCPLCSLAYRPLHITGV